MLNPLTFGVCEPEEHFIEDVSQFKEDYILITIAIDLNVYKKLLFFKFLHLFPEIK